MGRRLNIIRGIRFQFWAIAILLGRPFSRQEIGGKFIRHGQLRFRYRCRVGQGRNQRGRELNRAPGPLVLPTDDRMGTTVTEKTACTTGEPFGRTRDGRSAMVYTCLLYTSPSPRDRQKS